MIEIALCLAIIGFALVAIIGVLPTGLNVQKENREETVINFDASYLMDVLRNGSPGVTNYLVTNGLSVTVFSSLLPGQDSLTNYVVSITNYHAAYDSTTNLQGTSVDWFSNIPSNGVYHYSLAGTVYPSPILTNGNIIIGLLTLPKIQLHSFGKGNPPQGFYSNYTTADFRGISSPAVDQGASQTSQDFSFRYRVTPEFSPYSAFDPLWTNYNTGGLLSADKTNRINAWNLAQKLQGNLQQLRLRFNWPVLPTGQIGGGRQVFRTIVAGSLTNVPPLAPGMPNLTFVLHDTYTNSFPAFQ